MNKKTEALMKTLLFEPVVVIHAAFEETPRTVAIVYVEKALSVEEKLDKVFLLTNNTGVGTATSWYSMQNKKVVNYIGPSKTCRSTSVGDFMLIGNTKYKCETTGWSEV